MLLFLISSHILSELVKITNSILIINKGKIVTETSEEELKQFKDNDLENVLLNHRKGGPSIKWEL